MFDSDDRCNGEFYVAPIYNYLIKDNLPVGFTNIGKEYDGLHGLGTPEDLKIFLASPKFKGKMKYDLMYFGETRSFAHNIDSHKDLLNGSRRIVISTWSHCEVPKKLNQYTKKLTVITTEYRDNYKEAIGNIQLPKSCFNNSEVVKPFGTLPRIYLMHIGWNAIVNDTCGYTICLRPNLFIYNTKLILNTIKERALIHSKLEKHMISDQFFAGPNKYVEYLANSFIKLDQYWNKIKRDNLHPSYNINERLHWYDLSSQ